MSGASRCRCSASPAAGGMRTSRSTNGLPINDREDRAPRSETSRWSPSPWRKVWRLRLQNDSRCPGSLDQVSSNLPISSPYRSKPDAPVSDAERDRLNARLNAAYTAGALQQEDYQARLDLLFAAQRLGELVPVVEGLPPLPTYSSPAIVASSDGQPGELSESRPPGRLTAIVIGGVAAAVLIIAILLVLLI
jgi:hypothetical protein